MKFIQTANNIDSILEAHAYYTGRDFYAGYENVLEEQADHYANIV